MQTQPESLAVETIFTEKSQRVFFFKFTVYRIRTSGGVVPIGPSFITCSRLHSGSAGFCSSPPPPCCREVSLTPWRSCEFFTGSHRKTNPQTCMFLDCGRELENPERTSQTQGGEKGPRARGTNPQPSSWGGSKKTFLYIVD